MKELKNRGEIVEQLTETLMDFAKDLNKYQTDVYLYYDEETQTAELDTFVNVGGNSWLNDDHYTIYRDPEHYDDWTDYYTENEEFASGLDMDWKTLEAETKDYLELDEDEKEDYQVEYFEVRNYIKSREDYSDKLISVYESYIDETRPEYAEEAERIISEWEEDTE